jgi:hypothetical protein
VGGRKKKKKKEKEKKDHRFPPAGHQPAVILKGVVAAGAASGRMGLLGIAVACFR